MVRNYVRSHTEAVEEDLWECGIEWLPKPFQEGRHAGGDAELDAGPLDERQDSRRHAIPQRKDP